MTPARPRDGSDELAQGLRGLRGRAKAELQRLDRERERIERLLDLIDSYAQSGGVRQAKRRRPAPPRQPASIIEIVGERPGVRTSMLAMVSKRSIEEVAAELAEYERGGLVARDGLGWRTTKGRTNREG